jgi:hypothetical protein
MENYVLLEPQITILIEHNFRLADARIYKQFGWGDAFYIKNGL